MLRVGELKRRELTIRSRVTVLDERAWLTSLKFNSVLSVHEIVSEETLTSNNASWERRGAGQSLRCEFALGLHRAL
jgi:hypothetical protein